MFSTDSADSNHGTHHPRYFWILPRYEALKPTPAWVGIDKQPKDQWMGWMHGLTFNTWFMLYMWLLQMGWMMDRLLVCIIDIVFISIFWILLETSLKVHDQVINHAVSNYLSTRACSINIVKCEFSYIATSFTIQCGLKLCKLFGGESNPTPGEGAKSHQTCGPWVLWHWVSWSSECCHWLLEMMQKILGMEKGTITYYGATGATGYRKFFGNSHLFMCCFLPRTFRILEFPGPLVDV